MSSNTMNIYNGNQTRFNMTKQDDDRRYRQKHKEQIRLKDKEYYQKNKVRLYAKHKVYLVGWRDKQREINPERLQAYDLKQNKRRILFKDKRIHLKENPRTGMCTNCGKQNRKTDMHHVEYHDGKPLEDAFELCASCHGLTRGVTNS